MKDKWRVVIGVLLSAAVIAYILRTVDTRNVWIAITHANIPLLILAAIVATCCFPLRAIRWRVILLAVDPGLGFGPAWRATAVGFALNNALPLRLGEVARAYSLSRESAKISFPASIASLAIDRVFDAVTLIVFLVIGAFGLPSVNDAATMAKVYAAVTVTAMVAGALILVLVALAFYPARIIGLFEAVTSKLSPSMATRLSALLGSFAAGLSVLRNPGRFLSVLAWTIVHWLVNALAFWIAFKALGVHASFLAAMFTQTVIGFAIAAPQASGGIGAFQLAGAVALGLFGILYDDAIAWGFGYWAFSFVPITVIGMIYFTRMKLSLKELKDVMNRFKRGATHNG